MPIQISLSNAIGASQGLAGGGPGPGPGPGYTPPLDAYPADIAYSVRKLSSTYSGFCMEVQRLSDNATQDIGFDSNGLLDTQAIIDFVVAGGGVQEARVRTWYDQTGNSRHALQTTGSEMSYIYGGGSIREVNGKPVVDPIYGGDGLYYIQGTYSTAANNTIFTVISPGLTGGSYVMSRYSGAFTQGILGAGIEEPNGGWNSGIDFGFGTTQYYRDGALYGSGTTLLRNDIMQSVLSGRRIFGIGFTQSGLTEPLLRLGRDTSSSIYATQEYIVYFSDQLGTVPRTALEGNINSYYQVANLPDFTSGFLADYPDAAVAYSVRQLSNTAIKCMRVRRAVAPFDEQDIGFTEGGDLDEAAIVAFGGSDMLVVSAWYDQSGQSRHATQDNPTLQPQIYDGAAVITENGKPALSFDTDKLGEFSLPLSQPLTFNFVGRYAGDTAFPISAFFGSRDTTFVSFLIRNGDWMQQAPSLPPNSTTVDTNQHNWFLLYDGSSSFVGVDGGTAAISNPGTSALENFAIGARGIESANSELKYFQELVLWPGDQDGAGNRTGIETDINDYYEIVVNDEAATSGFLFDYPNADVAYSIRQLNNNATYSMQVMRSDGRAKNIGFDSNGDLDTQAIIDFAGASVATISQWYDQSGNQVHMAQNNPTLQPTIYDGASVITDNNKPCIEFLGASNLILQTANATPSLSQPTTYFVTANKPNHSSYLWDGISSRQAQGDQTWIFAGGLSYNFYPNSELGSQVLFTALFNGASSVGRINASQTATGNPGSNALGGIKILSKEGNKYQEFVVYGADQTSQFTPIESDIMTYFNIP